MLSNIKIFQQLIRWNLFGIHYKDSATYVRVKE